MMLILDEIYSDHKSSLLKRIWDSDFSRLHLLLLDTDLLLLDTDWDTVQKNQSPAKGTY